MLPRSARAAKAPLVSPAAQLQVRAAHDLRVSHDGRPLIRFGPGGRSTTTGAFSVYVGSLLSNVVYGSTGQVATVFGCTGFLGRYLVHKLGEGCC